MPQELCRILLNGIKQLRLKMQKTASKTAKDENFPVGSIFLPKKLRPHIACFYNFARYADDIADSSVLSKDRKIAKLEALELVLEGKAKADDETKVASSLKQSLIDAGVTNKHALDLLKAFKQDANEKEYQVWEELIYYCTYSASPVGRYMLELHNQPLSTHWSSDRLCVVLQILNHLQDLKKDYLNLKRIYLPSELMQQFGVKAEDLAKEEATKGLLELINNILDKTDNMLFEAKILPQITTNLGLRIEIAVILELALRLSLKLRNEDPIKNKVSLSKADWVKALIFGVIKAIFTRKKTTECL